MNKKILFWVLLLLIFQINYVKAQEEKYISLFLYNFTKHFDWPDEYKSGDFIIDIIGHESVFIKLKELTATKKVGSQNIVIRNYSDITVIGKCHILFVGHWQSRFMPQIIEKVGNRATLVVTEKEGLINQGSAINFIIKDGIIKFEFKKSNAIKYGLKYDPRIIEMAEVVYD
ncbi:MAG: YfiR family protein [Bacteroidales bacterium]|nr:MAG: YfiR family protein [Bacteroidales bacterium]